MNSTPTNLVDNRINQWKQGVSAEFSTAIEQAAQYLELSKSATTATKRSYFSRKYHKVKNTVIQMAMVGERLRSLEQQASK